MNRPVIARAVAIIAVLAFIAAQPAGHFSSSAQSERTYLALGDSIPAGLLASLPSERGYPALLRDLMEAEQLSSDSPANIELVNLAEPGETVQSFLENGQMAAALEEIETTGSEGLQTVTLTIGGNNILSLWESSVAEREAELDQFESNFTEVVGDLSAAVEDSSADVVVTTYYDLTDGDPSVEGSNAWWLRQFNDVITETADNAGFTVVDLESLFRDRITELTWFPADVHPNNAGHQQIARAIWQELAYDENAPQIEITRPEPGGTRSRVPTIYASVEDNVEIERVVLQVDDEEIQELIYVPEREAWIGLWDARDFDDSEGDVMVVATDVSGNQATDSVSLTLPAR